MIENIAVRQPGEQTGRFQHRFSAMGSPCGLQLEGADESELVLAAKAIETRVAELERKFSRYRPDSLTTQINTCAGTGEWVAIDEETAGLLRFADSAWEQSEGLFDLTSGVLRQAWDFRSGRLPDPQLVQQLLSRIGWDKLEWSESRLRLPLPGMEIDWGGVVKEYAVDQAIHTARELGVQHGWIDLGGDVGIIGPQSDGSGWRIGLRNPDAPQSAISTVSLRWGGLASSGDYERMMVVDGVRYGHVLNPRTGWPVRGVCAVSVVAESTLLAGAASTIAMLREGGAREWLQSLETPWLLVDDTGARAGPLASPAR